MKSFTTPAPDMMPAVILERSMDGKTVHAYTRDFKFPCGYPFQAIVTQNDEGPVWTATAYDPKGNCPLPQPGYGYSPEEAVNALMHHATRLYHTQSGWHSFAHTVAKACYPWIRTAAKLAMLIAEFVQ